LILYLDTSALVKRYFKEPYSEEVTSRWQEATEIATSSVAFAEAMAAFYRKKRESSIEDEIIRQIVDDFHEDWLSFIRIQVNEELNSYVDTILKAHPLRGFDAIHLASAIVLHEKIPADLLFMCFDQKLTAAVKAEGLQTFPTDFV
jgi:predicted nucleic acid-binding protein